MKAIIDRFEEDFAVVALIDGTSENLPMKLVPKYAKEGDVLEIRIDEEETDRRKADVQKLMGEVWER